jgi:hypothetical protein
MLRILALLIAFIGSSTITGLMIGAMFTGSLPSIAKWKAAAA